MSLDGSETMQNRLRELGIPQDATRIMYSSRSADVSPGKGASEDGDGHEMDISRLGPHWRRALSNFAPCKLDMPFGPNGEIMTFNSVEAAYQAGKFWINGLHDAVRQIQQCKNGQEARKLRKYVELDKYQMIKWKEVRGEVMENAMRQKFSKPEYRSILLATGTAHLTHQMSRTPSHGWRSDGANRVFVDNSEYGLMKIRNELAVTEPQNKGDQTMALTKLSEISSLSQLETMTKGKGKWSKDEEGKDIFTPTKGEAIKVSFLDGKKGTYLHGRSKMRPWLVENGMAEDDAIKNPTRKTDTDEAPKMTDGREDGANTNFPVTDKRFWAKVSDDDIKTVKTIIPDVLESRIKARKKATAREAIEKLQELGMEIPEDLAKLSE